MAFFNGNGNDALLLLLLCTERPIDLSVLILIILVALNLDAGKKKRLHAREKSIEKIVKFMKNKLKIGMHLKELMQNQTKKNNNNIARWHAMRNYLRFGKP